MSDSNTEETDEQIILCSQCKSNVIITELKEQPLWTKAPQLAPTAAATSQKVIGAGQRQKVFDRLGPQT
ncbi:hypothetical protein ACFX2J_022554 [Malus domestica]